MIDHLRLVDTLKLWAAFAQLGEEDPPTAAAALGCLAMAVRDPQVRKSELKRRRIYCCTSPCIFWW